MRILWSKSLLEECEGRSGLSGKLGLGVLETIDGWAAQSEGDSLTGAVVVKGEGGLRKVH